MSKESILFGYEWSYTCPDCGEKIGLAGMGYGMEGDSPKINGEEIFRQRRLHQGDEIECGYCGVTRRLEFEKI